MADAGEAAPTPAQRRRWPWPLRWALGLLVTLALAIGIAIWAIDTGPGHRFIVDRIASLPIKSGLRIRIGRIDGSIWGRATLRDLRLYDPQGLFLEAPEVGLDWRPSRWLANTLDIRRLESDLVVLHRLPKLRPPERRGPILPGFDIRIDRLAIAAVRIEPPVAGTRRIAWLEGRADIRRGRALIDLDARVAGGGDRLRIRLDAEPDRDRFDLEARLAAPADSVVGGIVGTRRPIALVVTGDGTWARWNGVARMDLSGRRTIDLALGVRDGRYLLKGQAAPSPFLSGKLQRLSAPRILIDGQATLADRRLAGLLKLRTPALSIDADGTIDLADSAFDKLKIAASLLRPPALFPNMTGRAIRLEATLDGPFATAAYDYRLVADRVAFDQTGFETVRAVGTGRLSPSPVRLPVRLTAARVTGVGDVAGGILRDLALSGTLDVTAKTVTGSNIALGSDKLKGKLALLLDLVTGRYTVTLSGGLTRYLIPGLGIVDVTSELRVVPDPSGRGTRVEGRGRAWVRRLDNGFLAGLAGGLPAIDTRLVRGNDGIVRFMGLRLTAPGIALAGNGYRRKDGTFFFEGGGRQREYGPLRLVLDGRIDRPRLAIVLASPMEALGLADVKLQLDPDAQGYAYAAAGGSTLGPFTSSGRIDLPRAAPALIRVAALAVSGTNATGTLRSDPGGFTGTLDLAGGGLAGQLLFAPVGDDQRIEAHLTADGATLTAATPVVLRRGKLDGAILLTPAGAIVDGALAAQGARIGPVSLASLSAKAALRAGRGTVAARIAGSRGRAFALDVAADVAPEAIALSGSGTVDRRPIRLEEAARFTRDGDGWRLAPARFAFAGGTARVGGRFGGSATELDATLQRMPLTVLDIGFPGLGLGGSASGTLTYRLPAGGTPTGRTDLRIRGLTRSGLVLSSQPVDVGLAAVLGADGAAGRAIVASAGKTIGRAQARLAPLGPGADLMARLRRAPLFAQLRYAGPADTLWRLTGVETIDLSGPVSIGADMRGTLADPSIRGSLATDNARLESAVTGTVIQKIAAAGRFNGSRLAIDRFAGTTANGGSVSGRGVFDLAAAGGLGMDLAITADRAILLARDDIGATVTGPLTIRSDGSGGTIAGDVDLIASRFRLGRAAAAAVPRLAVREINRPADEPEATRPPSPWRLDLKADARNRLMVSGLGLDSEWRTRIAIRGTVDNPAITGTADLIRGNYEFAGRRFDLDRGAIRFNGEAPPDPALDIVAQANLQGLNATIRVTGTGLKPDIDFASVPALPEDELLSRLLFGSSITNLSAPEALQLAAAVASLNAGGNGDGLNPINSVRRAAGLDRLRILPADPTTGQGTSVAAGKYLGRRTYVELISDGAGYSATRVEFQITRWLSLLSSISTIGRQSANVRISKDY